MLPVKNHIIQQKQQVTFSAIIKKNQNHKTTQTHILEHNWVDLSKRKKYTWSSSIK